MRVNVICAPDLPTGDERRIHAINGAVTEALTNASKHGKAESATVYAEPGDDHEFFVSINDRGTGFDPATQSDGQGLTRSIRGRIVEAGGTVDITSRPGRGTEVTLHL